ncbi:MAG: hypothetical protein IPM24_26000 [Bryobacterales bacterium]|nr:hypothetical protein [Bryobacterales bacterium]
MKIAAGLLVAVIAALPLAAAEASGKQPLRSATDYGAAAYRDGIGLGVRLLSLDETRRMGLSTAWVVAEVGVYPGDGDLRVTAADFVLYADEGRLRVLPVSASAMPRAAVTPPTGPAPVSFASERDGGVLITTVREAQVRQNGPMAPAPSSLVTDSALPEGAAGKPVAGYLYFAPALGPVAGGAFELEYLGATRPIRLRLSRAE